MIVEAYFSLYPEKKDAETVHCFFDEIQALAGWEPFVDRLIRTERREAVLTGSSARMLSKEIATQTRGRALSWELFPFSFREFLDGRGVETSGPFSTKRRLLVRKGFDKFRETGVVVTRNEEDWIGAGGGRRIRVVPAWRFLLDLPDAVE